MIIDLLVIILGLAFGSFLNVVIYRLPRKEPIILSRSHCPHCGKKIRFYDNIPVISFIILGGRCRDCKARISFRYPIIEIITALLFFLSNRVTPNLVEFIISIYLSSVAIVITFIDFDHKIIPNLITYPGVIIGILSSIVRANMGLVQSVLGVLIGAGLLWVIALLGEKIFRREAMGFGDVKYIALIGAFVGPIKVILVIIVSSFLGAVVGSVGLALAKNKAEARIIPYGPYLSAAMLIVYWFGDRIIEIYKSLIYLS